jgi:hypothetical protein
MNIINYAYILPGKPANAPVRVLVGDLSLEDQFLVGLNLVRLDE